MKGGREAETAIYTYTHKLVYIYIIIYANAVCNKQIHN